MKGNSLDAFSGIIHFSKWKRKSYSLFQVIGKIVRIGVLAIAYLAAIESAEAQKEFQRTQSVDDTDVTLEEVEVKGQRISTSLSDLARLITVVTQKEIARSPYLSIQDFLDQELSIDVRQRGPHGAQSDISIKGSTYEQVLILINGIPFNDPQTGHFNGDIPVPLSAVQRIEIIDGGASRWLGPNAFAGAVNIITKTNSRDLLKVKLQLGQNSLYNSEVLSNFQKNDWDHLISGSYSQTDGYAENTDLKSWKSYYSGQLKKDEFIFYGQAGIGAKKFGAQAFYTPVYPNQYEELGSCFSSFGWTKNGRFSVKQDVYIKYHLDEFHLFREGGPAWYTGPNQHLSRVIGLVNNVWWNNKIGRVTIGLDYRSEAIWSSVLGFPDDNGREIPGSREQTFAYSAMRQSLSCYGEQSWTSDRLSMVAGILSQVYFNDSQDISLFPGVDIKYRIGNYSHIFSSVNRSLRAPSFTELYYLSPTNQGNPLLKPESAWSSQFGYRFSKVSAMLSANIYGRFSKNSIDWSKAPGEEKWHSRNINELFQMGFEVQGSIKPITTSMFRNMKVKFGYRYGYVSKSSGDYDSRYVLDYLQHKVIISSFLPLGKHLVISIMTSYQDRAGDYKDWDKNGLAYRHEYDPFCLIDMKIEYKMLGTSIFMDVNNLLDKNYADISLIVQPGRWISFGCNLSLTR
ncbi:MAG: TonB-dependent receptor [Bacteroidales bacterium]|nr:TonB-dependent receptor [Bacteroidales bacterium]